MEETLITEDHDYFILPDVSFVEHISSGKIYSEIIVKEENHLVPYIGLSFNENIDDPQANMESNLASVETWMSLFSKQERVSWTIISHNQRQVDILNMSHCTK